MTASVPAGLEAFYPNAAVFVLTLVSHLWMRLQLISARRKYVISYLTDSRGFGNRSYGRALF